MKIRLSRFLLVPMLCFLICVAVHRPTYAPNVSNAAQQFAPLGDLKLQSGEVMHDFRLGYRTMGALNAAKSNAILWPTWLGGRTENLVEFIGPGRVVDSSQYFVILVDSIGDGVTTSPSNSKTQPWMKFPQFTIRDMVESERRLVTEVLHLAHLRAVMGVSMGGMQTFEWAVVYPGLMDEAIPMLGSPQSTSYDKLLWTAEIDAVELDPAWNHGHPSRSMARGLTAAEEIDSLNLFSPTYRATHTAPADFDGFLADLRKNVRGDGGTASDHIRQRQAIIAFDIPAELGVTIEQAAARVRARMLAIVATEDQMVNPLPALKFAAAMGAPTVTVDSPCGHASLRCVSLGPTVAQFLADPASVHSMTLHDASKP
jgi:homoserine O-acetyltransferase/O-succinyltransferase